MDGTAQLLQLSHLLRIGADTARDIATIRNVNVEEIRACAKHIQSMADNLEEIARRPSADGQPTLAKAM